MTDTDHQIIHLLTELRDLHREDLAYRRRVLEESMLLQRRSVRMQRLALPFLLGVVIVLIAVMVIINLLANRDRQTNQRVALTIPRSPYQVTSLPAREENTPRIGRPASSGTHAPLHRSVEALRFAQVESRRQEAC